MTPEKASEYILRITKEKRDRLDTLILDAIDSGNYSTSRLNSILLLLDSVFQSHADILNTLLLEAYKDSWEDTSGILHKSGGPSFDINVINVLVKDTMRDLFYARDQSKAVISNFFKIAKQEILSEGRVSEIALERIMEQGTYHEISKQISNEMKAIGSKGTSRLRNLSEDEISQRFNRANRAMLKTGKIPQYLKTKVLDRVEDKLREGKFITILSNRKNKFGQRITYTYSLDYYTELVAKSRYADSQVQAQIDIGERLGNVLYYVTEHNTESKQCKPYEGKYLTTNPKLVGKFFEGKEILILTKDSRPIYHPNCKHRLLVVPITHEEYVSILGARHAA